MHGTGCQCRLQLCGALQDPVLPEPLGILPLFLLGVEGGQLILFINTGGWDGIDKLFRRVKSFRLR